MPKRYQRMLPSAPRVLLFTGLIGCFACSSPREEAARDAERACSEYATEFATCTRRMVGALSSSLPQRHSVEELARKARDLDVDEARALRDRCVQAANDIRSSCQ